MGWKTFWEKDDLQIKIAGRDGRKEENIVTAKERGLAYGIQQKIITGVDQKTNGISNDMGEKSGTNTTNTQDEGGICYMGKWKNRYEK